MALIRSTYSKCISTMLSRAAQRPPVRRDLPTAKKGPDPLTSAFRASLSARSRLPDRHKRAADRARLCPCRSHNNQQLERNSRAELNLPRYKHVRVIGCGKLTKA